jgi:hypothetical protein
VFLDEPENPTLVEYIDYLDQGNVIEFAYLNDWRKNYTKTPNLFTLQQLLIKVNTLFTQAPPIDM